MAADPRRTRGDTEHSIDRGARFMVQSMARRAPAVTTNRHDDSLPMSTPTANAPPIARRLDITRDICPITFVKTKLELEEMSPGALLEVLVREGESLTNVARSVAMDGHAVVVCELHAPAAATKSAAIWRLVIKRGEAP